MSISRRDLLLSTISTVAASALAPGHTPAGDRPRARDLGLAPGVFPPGPLNAITDVSGVRVGHVTLIEADRIRTGVTAIVPHGGNVFQEKVPGGVFIGNAFGKLAGSTQVLELGTIETPVVLTNTLSVGAGMQGAIRWTLRQPGNDQVFSVNALVGETNDSWLNDIVRCSSRRSTWSPRSTPRKREPLPRAVSAPARGRCASAGKAASARRRA
jgi:D-aminopeptidase